MVAVFGIVALIGVATGQAWLAALGSIATIFCAGALLGKALTDYHDDEKGDYE